MDAPKKLLSNRKTTVFYPSLVLKGAFVWDQSGMWIIRIMRESVCLGAIRIPEYLEFHSGYSAPRSRITGIYSYSRISHTNAPLVTSYYETIVNFVSSSTPFATVVQCTNREFKMLRRQLQRKRHIKIELCVKLSLLRLFHVDHVVQNTRIALSLAWYERFSCKKAKSERFTAASSRCRQNLKYENFTS